MTYLIFLLGIILNGAASFTLKILTANENNLISIATLRNPLLYLAVLLFISNIVLYGIFLQRTNLVIGYPAFVGGTFVVVLGLSLVFLKESLSLPQIFGISFIFIGILLAVK